MDYEKEYSPSQWVVRTTPELACKLFYDTLESQSARCKRMKLDKTVQLFNDDPVNSIQLFTPSAVASDNEEAMVFAFIPGGYWQDMNVKAYKCVGEQLAFGARAIYGLITYQVAPAQSVEQQIEVVAEGLKKLAELRPKARAIAIAGHSAGAHLMCMALAHLQKTDSLPSVPIRHLYSISGIYDCVPITKMSVNKPLGWSEQQARELSPISQDNLSHLCDAIKQQKIISKQKNASSTSYASMEVPCQFYSIAGEYESDEFKRQAKDFANAITKHSAQQVNAEFFEVAGVDHFDIIESLYEMQYRLTRMLVRNCGGRLPSTSMH